MARVAALAAEFESGLGGKADAAYLGEFEIHCDACLKFRRFPVVRIRLITPLLHGIRRRLCQDGVTREQLQRVDPSLLVHNRLQDDRTMELLRSCLMRIRGMHTMNYLIVSIILGNLEDFALRSCYGCGAG